jgi:hypothetical protein
MRQLEYFVGDASAADIDASEWLCAGLYVYLDLIFIFAAIKF